MKKPVALLWFRNDLRLHDHEALIRSLAYAEKIVPVYCLDPRQFGKTSFGFDKTGPYRARFLRESIQVLRERLREKGGNLLIVWGKPEEVLPKVAEAYGATALFAHKEVTSEEVQVEQATEKALFAMGVQVNFVWGATLYHLEDLPMPLHALPEVFTQFRKQVERYAVIREEFETPELVPVPHLHQAFDLENWDVAEKQGDERAVLSFRGGETAGLERLYHYFWESDCLSSYKETRNGLIGPDYSSKFSPWLALGCISPRKVYFEVKRYEKLRKKNSSTYWLVFELIWRDYFRFVCKKYGDAVFFRGGLKGRPRQLRQDWQRFDRWREGMTGIPLVDANMRELAQTGFMSNRGRQNVASFLVNDLGVDWRMGAAYFESMLIDYDVCSNWGNWNYVAGVGNDPREGRYFNVISQSKRYDPQGDYLRLWLPELATLSAGYIHTPATLSRSELLAHGLTLGKDYPFPLIEMRARHPN